MAGKRSTLDLLFFSFENIRAASEGIKVASDFYDKIQRNKGANNRYADAHNHLESAFLGASEIANSVIGTVKGWLPSFETHDGNSVPSSETQKNVALLPDKILISIPGVQPKNLQISKTDSSIIVSILDYTNRLVNPLSVSERIEIPLGKVLQDIHEDKISYKNGCLIIPIGKIVPDEPEPKKETILNINLG